jgi:CTP synthase (UTP-ammonia lyase)
VHAVRLVAHGLNPDYLERLSAGGLTFSGFDDSGQVRIAELPGHPFFIGTLFQPELHGDGSQPHPIIVALAAAATARAKASGESTVLAG